MLFIDDIVLVDEIREGVNANIERWRGVITRFQINLEYDRVQ